MAKMTEADLKKQIREKNMCGCYLFYGTEEYLKQFYTNKIAEKFVTPGSETFSLRKYDGKDNTLDDVFEGANSMPFMSEYTVVIAHDFPFDSFNKEQKEKLADFLNNQPDTSITVFWMDSVDVSIKNQKTKWAIDLFVKNAAAVEFQKPSGRELLKLICAYAKKNGCEMNENAASYLVQLSGDSLNILFNEVQKVCNYAGQSNEVTKEHVEMLAVRSLEAKVFDLSKHILAGNPDKALELLHSLMLQKEEPIEIFSVILMTFLDIYRAKVSVSSGESELYCAKLYDYRNKEFRLTNGGRYSRKISNEQLRECFDIFNDGDYRLKNTGQDGEMILERLIINLCLVLARV